MGVKEMKHYGRTFKRNNIWTVTTEGDVEGRSTLHLGTFHGKIDEIAFALADKACYKLEFEAVKSIDLTKQTKPEVHICVKGLNSFSLLDILNSEFKDDDNTNIRAEKSKYYESVKLTTTPKENPEQAMVRKLKAAGFDPREVINTFRQR